MSSRNNRKLVILTGAGFSKSFGLPLAIDLKHTLHNKLRNNSDLIEKLKCENANFEDIYSELENESDPSNFEEFKKAVIDIFNSMIDRYNNIEDAIKHNARDHLILKLFENIDENDCLDIFTLNMDVLFEHPQLFNCREASVNDGIDLFYPGLFHICKYDPEQYNNYSDRKIDRMWQNNIIEEVVIDYNKKYSDEYFEQKNIIYSHKDSSQGIFTVKKLFYWKLHGSISWKDKEKNDLLIFGKEKHLENNPLLKFYLDNFEEKINMNDVVIIGYGFCDEHINKIIYDAVENSGTKVHVINPEAGLDRPFYREKLERMEPHITLHPYTFNDLYTFTETNYPWGLVELYKILNLKIKKR